MSKVKNVREKKSGFIDRLFHLQRESKTASDDINLLSIHDGMESSELLRVLRINALKAHQRSVGQGDMLVQFLQRTVDSMETTHKRLQSLSTIFFVFGLLVISSGAYVALAGNAGGEVWGSMFGVGGLASGVSIFYTGPLNRIAQSVRDLVQLETAFLGYIRVIGEIDSAFQWQYLEKMEQNNTSDISMIAVSTTANMKEIMRETMNLIDQYTSSESSSKIKNLSVQMEKLKKDLDTRLKKLESTV